VNVDEEPAIANAFQIRSIPTVVAMRGKEVLDVQIGFGGPQSIIRLFDGALDAVPVAETA